MTGVQTRLSAQQFYAACLESKLSEYDFEMSIPAPIEPPDRSLRATIPAAQSHYSGGGNHHSGN